MLDNAQRPPRNEYIDIVKGVAIVLVVLGHSIQFGSGSDFRVANLFFSNWVYRIIYSFHMPLFMITGGFLASYSLTKKNVVDIVSTRIKSLIFPAVSWSTLFASYDFVVKYLKNGESIRFLKIAKSYIKSCLFDLWFLWAMLVCIVLILIGRYFFKDRIWFYFAITLVALFLTDNWNFHLYKFNFPFFVAGYLYNKNNITSRFKNVNHRKILMGYGFVVIIYILLMTKYDYNSFIYTSKYAIIGMDLNKNLQQIMIDVYRFAVAICGIVVVLGLLYGAKTAQLIPTKVLIALSKNSLCIYSLSHFLNSRLLMKITEHVSFRYGLVLLETFVMLVLTYGIAQILKKGKVFGVLLLGGR